MQGTDGRRRVLIWTAIAASVLKRYLAQMTQAFRGV